MKILKAKNKEDNEVVLFCNHNVASDLVEIESEILNTLIITNLLEDDTVYVVDKKEFLDWLLEREKE